MSEFGLGMTVGISITGAVVAIARCVAAAGSYLIGRR